jgi:hypothetical protein
MHANLFLIYLLSRAKALIEREYYHERMRTTTIQTYSPKARKDGPKPDTKWYDDLCLLYQKTRIPELRNVLWDQVRGIVHGRVHQFIREKKVSILLHNQDLCQKLFQESFFIFVKAVDIWDPSRNTKFLTFLGDILNQEILNIIRLDLYYKTRDKKLEDKLKLHYPIEEQVNESRDYDEDFERQEMLEEMKTLFENYPFKNQIDRDIVYTMIYGKMGDWSKLSKRLGVGLGKLYKMRLQIIEDLRNYIEAHCSTRLKCILQELLVEK